MNGSFSVKTWLAIVVPVGAFLMGILGVGVWKGEITTRLNVVESIAKNNEKLHRDEMWEVRTYLHSLDKNILVIATKMEIEEKDLSSLELEMPKRANLSN